MIFISNDDGIHAEGINFLKNVFSDNEVFVSAPLNEKSGAGHSITLNEPLRITKFAKNIMAVNGTPVDSVFVGLDQLKQKPKLLISGINRGANLGNDLLYSGTFAAANEGFSNNITSIALSIYSENNQGFNKENFKLSAQIFKNKILPFLEKEVENFYETPRLFNINIPVSTLKNNQQIVWTKLGKRNYGNLVIKRTDPRGKDYFWIGGDQFSFEKIENSDINAVLSGKISITPIKICLTNKDFLTKKGITND